MNRRSMLIPVAVLAATVAVNPASAADGNGWQCISPFANYTNGTYPDDPPAPGNIIDTLAISVTREDSSPLMAVPGQALPLRDLQLKAVFTDVRPVEQMYRRTGGITVSYSGIPRGQEEDNSRSFSQRANPGDNNVLYWSYNTAGQGQPANYVYPSKVSAGPPQIRTADQPKDTPDFTVAAPSVNLAHRYLSHTGNSQFPLDAWVTIAASNTVEGVQTLPVKGNWTANIKDATPGTPAVPANYTNDAVTASVEPVVLNLPRTNWTPTGAGPVEFTVAPPGNMGIIQTESKGYDRVGYNSPLNIRPFGSVYIRAQTESYGSSNDCISGAITVVNNAITASQAGLLFANADPVTADPALGDPATPGAYTTAAGAQKAVGVRGRFGFAAVPLPALAVAALPPVPVALPKPALKPVTLGSKSTMKPSSAGSVKLSLTNPNAAAATYKLAVKTVGKYKVGKTRKTVTVAAGKTVTLKPGASSVSFKLSSAAKTLLKQRKSVKVKVTLTPTSGGSAVTKTITLKRS
ncbi:MAG: hypothetical protein QOE05_2796 [Actinomycetota bacterium]|nr:hypothetical protein [Actinomycetota bacterium]